MKTYASDLSLEAIVPGPGDTRLLRFREDSKPTFSAFRIYDRHWRPVTPLLEVNLSLSTEGAVPDGFIASVGIPRPWGEWRERWGHIDLDGTIRLLAGQLDSHAKPQRLRRHDVPLENADFSWLAYRPSTDAVFKRPPEPPDVTGCGWGKFGYPHVGDLVRTTSDHGRTWRTLSTSVIGTSFGALLIGCEVTGDQISVYTGDEDFILGVHTLSLDTGQLYASHRLGYSLDPSNTFSLPSGTLVSGTIGRGLMVGTTPHNVTLEFRPGRIKDMSTEYLIGNELMAAVYHPRAVWVTTDEARTWKRHDLAMPR